MENYKIGEKEYTEEELIEFGKQHYPKFYWIYRGVGLALIGLGLLMTSIIVISGTIFDSGNESSNASNVYFLMAIPYVIIGLIGAVLFGVSFIPLSKEKYITHALKYLKKNALKEEQALANKSDKDITQLLKYKELLDAGIISQEEFDTKKKELL